MNEQKSTEKNSTVDEEVRRIRTYGDDMAESIQKGGVSATHIVAAEQDRSSRRLQFEFEEKIPFWKKRSVVISFTGIILIVLVVTSFYLLKPSATPTPPPNTLAHIFTPDYQKEIVVAGFDASKLKNTLAEERKSASIPVSSILSLDLLEKSGVDKKAITTEYFLKTLSTNIPSSLTRALDETFMAGLYAYNGNQPFLVFKVNSYANAFAGMLKWEQYLTNDLGVIFLERNTLAVFGDTIIENGDARVIKNENSKIILLYSFPDPQHLVITSNEKTLIEIKKRLGK